MSADDRLRELNIELPATTPAMYTYDPVKQVGDLAYFSGLISRGPDGGFISGKIGADRTIEEGQAAARACGLHVLAAARSITGSLDDIEFVKLLVFVNSAPDFVQHAAVAEGCSQLLVEVLGGRGLAARSAIGASSLPANACVEVEGVIRIIGA